MGGWVSQSRPLDMLKRGLSRRPWYVVLYVTSHCNQRCNMCFNWKMLNSLKRAEEWSLDEFRLLAKQLPDLYQLTLSGGEPALRKDLPEIVEIFYKETGVKRVTIATNGFYPDRIGALLRQVTRTCPDLILSINISLDEIGEAHDEIRGVKGSFENLVRTWRLVKSYSASNANINTATASVLTVSNAGRMKDILAWVAKNLDIENHGIMLARGNVASGAGSRASYEAFKDILSYHRGISRTARWLNGIIADEYAAVRIETVRSRRMTSPCRAGDKLLIIDERANVHPCEILNVLAGEGKTSAPELGNFCFGNLRDAGFNLDALLGSPRGKAIRKYISDKNCWCTFECAQINNLVLDPLSYPRLFLRAAGFRRMPR